MAMHFFLMTGLVIIWEFDVQWHPGHENLADNYTKHFYGKHHMEVRPWYLHKNNSPRLLPIAEAPIALRGCVGSLPNGYIRLAPLLWIPLGTTNWGHQTSGEYWYNCQMEYQTGQKYGTKLFHCTDHIIIWSEPHILCKQRQTHVGLSWI